MPKRNRCSSFEMDFLAEFTHELVINYAYREMKEGHPLGDLIWKHPPPAGQGVFLAPDTQREEPAFLTVYNDDNAPLTPGFPAAHLVYYRKGLGSKPEYKQLLGPAVERPLWAARWARSLVSQIRDITEFYNGDYEVCIEK